jgi:hypothetical protein
MYSFRDILDYSKILHLTEIIVKKELTLKDKDDLKIINSPSFKGIKVVFHKESNLGIFLYVDTVIIAKSTRSPGNFQISLLCDDKPCWHITITPELEPTTDSCNSELSDLEALQKVYAKFLEVLKSGKCTAYILEHEDE